MGTTGGTGAAVGRRPARGLTARTRAHALDAATAAWLALLPCALVTLALVAGLGPPLGSLLKPAPGAFTFLPVSAAGTFDDGTEHARYLLALTAPLLLALATWWIVRRRPPLSERTVALAVAAAQASTAALLVACVVVQYRIAYGATYTRVEGVAIHERYFNPATLVAAAAIAAALVLGVRSERVRERFAAAVRETAARRWIATAGAAAVTVVWLLHAVNTEESVAAILWPVRYHLGFTLDEAFAVTNGLTPLVDFSAQYSSLWPFLAALALAVAGKTVLVFTLTMCALTALALLSIYGVLRRATGSSLGALLLYVPFVATSLFAIGAATVNRGSFANYFGIFPLRYVAPYLVAWLAARHLERRGRDVSAWLLFAAAGLALINNADFGAAALGASVAACIWGASDLTRRSLLSLLRALAAGLATALVLVAALTLARTGSLPQLDRVVDYARIYGVGGYAMLPLPSPLGIHLAIYVTYVAAIAVATVRALRRAPNVVLTGMLAWAGVFGLGAASYYVGRSQPEALRTTFSAWALALALLAYAVLRALAAEPRRRPSIAAVAVLVGFGVSVCSVVQVPLPWSQLSRIQAGFADGAGSHYRQPLAPPQDARTRRFVASIADGPSRFVYRRGAPLAILLTLGHRAADAYGVTDVSPYTGVESIHTTQQVDAVVRALRDAGGNTVVLPATTDQANDGSAVVSTDPGMFAAFAERGFGLLTRRGLAPYDPAAGLRGAVVVPWLGGSVVKLVDLRHLHPRALG